MTTVFTEASRCAAPAIRPTLGNPPTAAPNPIRPAFAFWPFTDSTDIEQAEKEAAELARHHILTGADMSAVLADAYQTESRTSAALAARVAYVKCLQSLARAGLEG